MKFIHILILLLLVSTIFISGCIKEQEPTPGTTAPEEWYNAQFWCDKLHPFSPEVRNTAVSIVRGGSYNVGQHRYLCLDEGKYKIC